MSRYIIGLILSLLLLGCEASKYDTLDFYSATNADVVLEAPLYFTVQGSKNYIMVWWNYPLNQTISVTFSLYRSEENADNFVLLTDNIPANSPYYYDTAVEPGKTYYYKVCADSILYGKSEFSEIKSGVRLGRGVDIYNKEFANNVIDKSMKIEFDVTYNASLYVNHDTAIADCDYYTLDAKKGDILRITVKLPEDGISSALSSYDIKIFSKLNDEYKEINSLQGETLQSSGNSYLIFFSRDTPIYIAVSTDSVSASSYKTGDYDIVVSKEDSAELFKAYSTSSISYVKIYWSSYFSQMATKYVVQRRESDSEEWKDVQGSLTPYRMDVQSEFEPTVMQMYDRSAEVGKIYEYRVVAHIEVSHKIDDEIQKNEIDFYSSIVENVEVFENRPNVLPEDTPDNIDFDNALEIKFDDQLNGAIDTPECRYYKVTLEAGKTYYFSVFPYSSAGKVLFSVDFFGSDESGNKNRLIHISPEEVSTTYGNFSYSVPADSGGDYWLRIDGNNTLGMFSIIVKEDDSE